MFRVIFCQHFGVLRSKFGKIQKIQFLGLNGHNFGFIERNLFKFWFFVWKRSTFFSFWQNLLFFFIKICQNFCVWFEKTQKFQLLCLNWQSFVIIIEICPNLNFWFGKGQLFSVFDESLLFLHRNWSTFEFLVWKRSKNFSFWV